MSMNQQQVVVASIPTNVVDPASAQQMKCLQQHLVVLNDANAKDEAKLKAAQELSDNLDVALSSPHYPQFLEMALRVFLKVLQVPYIYYCVLNCIIEFQKRMRNGFMKRSLTKRRRHKNKIEKVLG